MIPKIPKAFLSLSAEDAAFVERVYRHLPHGQAFFYKQSFPNGALMLDAMEREVATSQLFVLFASKASLKSVWVNFEIEQARLAQISNRKNRLLIFPADSNVSSADLPEWMRAFWFDRKTRTPRDVARAIGFQLLDIVAAPENRMFGRGALQDVLRRKFSQTRKELGGQSPNVVLTSGLEQIGRETILKNTLPLLFPGLPYIGQGPVLDLPIWSGIQDIYRAVREIVEESVDLKAVEDNLAVFEKMDLPAQIQELNRSLTHFDDLGEAVTDLDFSDEE